MTKLFAALFAIFCFSSSYAQQIEQCENTTIIITDKSSPSKSEVIKNLLDLQRSLIIQVGKPVPEEYAKNGFLLIQMPPEYVENLLEQKDGLIVGAYQGQTLVGYILLIDISEFKELYQEESIGCIETSIDLEMLETLLSRSTVGYIEQIAVKRGYSKTGIGTQLINASKKLKPDGLVADVFIDPLTNDASLHFFSRLGFEKSGILHQNPTVNFPYAHRTQVFFWNLHRITKITSENALNFIFAS